MVNITKYKSHPKERLIEKLKKVTLLNHIDSPVYVYKKAKIDLTSVDIKELLPLQLYELASSSKLVANLYKIFQKKYKEDILNMNGYATYISDEKHYAFVPPIVEYVKDKKGKVQKIIIDGLHRVLLAKRLKKKKINVVAIENVPQRLNLPAAPNSWRDLKLLKTAPESRYKRKWLVVPEKGYLYYRNFQSVFQNIGKPRVSDIGLNPIKVDKLS